MILLMVKHQTRMYSKRQDLEEREFPFSLKRNGVNLIIDDSTVNNGVIIKNTIDLVNNSTEYENILLRHHMPVIEFELIANNRENEKHLPSMKNLSKLFNKKIIIISGDSGAFDHLPRITCRRLNNIVMIANGIGVTVMIRLLFYLKEFYIDIKSTKAEKLRCFNKMPIEN